MSAAATEEKTSQGSQRHLQDRSKSPKIHTMNRWVTGLLGTVILSVSLFADDFKFAVGSGHVLVVSPDGVLYGAGRNNYGQSAGDIAREAFARFTPVAGVPKVVDAFIPGGFSSMALGADGKVYVWGRHDFGLLGGDGRNTNDKSRTPTAVPGLDRVRGIAGGRYAGAAVREDGSVWMWGADRNGVMGTGTVTGPYESGKEYHQPRQVGGLAGVAQIASGEAHMLALKKDGTVWSWGWNKFGQLGLGDTEDRGRPTMVPGLTGVTRIYAVAAMSAAQLADGSWRLWGKAGPVGVGTTDAFRPALEPKPLPAHLRTTVDLGGAVFLLRDGSVWTWGDNSFGTLGTGGDTSDFSASGVQLKQLTGIVRVWSDGTRTMALKNDGTLYLWGPRFVSGNARVPMELGKFPAMLTKP
jgi:alpha-tubulin suppressor-like RCC1 family protein